MQSNQSTTYQSSLTVVIFLLIIWLISGVTLIAQIAVGVGFSALLSSHIARWIDYGWTKVLAALGWFNSRVLLSVVFFLILAPIAFIYRLVKGDTLNLKTGKESYFIDRSHKYEAKDLENPW